MHWRRVDGVLYKNNDKLSDPGSEWRDVAIHWVGVLSGGNRGGPDHRVVATDAELGKY